jgi:hypothetical protein
MLSSNELDRLLSEIGELNTAFFPAQIMFAALATVLLLLCYSRSSVLGSRAMKALLAVIYALNVFGITKCAIELGGGFYAINAAMHGAITVMFVGSLFRNDILFILPEQRNLRILSVSLTSYGIFVYPVVELLLGYEWPEMFIFGAMCPTGMFAIGLLITSAMDARSPSLARWLLGMLSAAAVIVGARTVAVGGIFDIPYLISGLIGLYLLLRYLMADTDAERRAPKARLLRIGATNSSTISGTRFLVVAFAALCGATGVMAGCFEISQGNVETDGFVITTIDSENILAGELTYFAVTVIPNMLLTGIASIIVSTMVVVWAIWFVHGTHGPLVLLGLLVAQTLVGGGWILDMAVITVILATRIGKPLSWWRRHMTGRTRVRLDRLLYPSLACYAIICICLIALTVMLVDDPSLWGSLNLLATIMFVPMVLMILGALAHDVGRQPLPD